MDRPKPAAPRWLAARTSRRIGALLIGALVVLPLTATSTAGGPASARLQIEACALPPPQTLFANILDSLEWDVVSERTIANVHGDPYREVDMASSGQFEGCTLLDTPGQPGHFTDAPELWFGRPISPQPGLPWLLRPRAYEPVYHSVATLDPADRSGMTVLYPESRSAWNGKVWIVQHSTGINRPIGELAPRDPQASFNPLMGGNFYAALMVDKGYAVAWIRKDTAAAAPVTTVQLDDGTTVKRTLTHHATLELAYTRYAQQFIEERLGEAPRRTYFYGFSGGGQTGRLMNYMPEANLDRDGTRIVDGFLIDAAAVGFPLPVLFRGHEDVLLRSPRDRATFAPQLDISHALHSVDSWLVATRENARLLLEKGLGDKHRVYEVAGVSLYEAGERPWGRAESLDLGALMDAMIDLLDEWVEAGVVPPPSRAIGVEGVEGLPLALPEIACPLGVHYPFPADAPDETRATNSTTFARFDGTGLEPLDWNDMFVDMNGNGVQDERETVEAAWRRLGLLGAEDVFTPQRYAACVEDAAVSLAEERLLPWRVVAHYRSEAARFGSGE
jgi:Alpha/beta hydrolase domain